MYFVRSSVYGIEKLQKYTDDLQLTVLKFLYFSINLIFKIDIYNPLKELCNLILILFSQFIYY